MYVNCKKDISLLLVAKLISIRGRDISLYIYSLFIHFTLFQTCRSQGRIGAGDMYAAPIIK